MKKLFIGILLAGLVTCQAGPAQGQSPAAQWTTARQWNKGVVGWNLGNQLECSAPGQDGETLLIGCPEGSLKAETAWGNPVVTEKTIQAVKEAGFNAVRIPVRWQCHIVNEQAMVVDKEWIARVKQVVDWCLKFDLKVILNTHHEKWLESRPTYAFQEENCRKLSLLWLQIATEFEGYDARLAFAGTNEVHIRDNWGAPTAENLDVPGLPANVRATPVAGGLLRRAGFALTSSSKFDIVLEYFLQHRVYDVYEINQVLFQFDLPLLGSGAGLS